MTKSKISETEALGLSTWRQEARAFLEDQFPKTTITLGITALGGSFTLQAIVPARCPYPSTDLDAAFDLLGINVFATSDTPD